MSRHEGVSCDCCLKGNFRGKRYKCLTCYDYDLCATCYEAGASTTRHNADHPMQCILTRADFDLYYGGEAVSVEHPQSITCPFCGKMGFTEATLTEHVSAEHSDSSVEVVCPICASQPGGEPNHVTDDFPAHLALDHRNRDLEEPSTSRHVRRIPHSGRGMNTSRPRRSQMQFTSGSGFSSLSPNSRDSMDPIAELLSQLSNVRRSANLAQSSTTSQLQQLQMQLHMERQQAQVARQQLERIPRRQATTTTSISGSSSAGNASLQSNYAVSLEPSSSLSSVNSGPQFLLSRCTEPVLSENELQSLDIERADRSLFVQELLLSSLGQDYESDAWDEVFRKLGLFYDSDTMVGEGAAVATAAAAARSSSDGDNHAIDWDPVSAINEADHASSNHQQQHNLNNEADDQMHSALNPPQRAVNMHGRPSNRSMANNNNPNTLSNRGNTALRNSRDGLTGGSRQIGRTGNRESSSPSRRKSHRQVDEKNKTTEPPPPH